MVIDTNTMVSMTEANQNFSKVARIVDERGSVVIMKNNMPKYLVVDFNEADAMSLASDADVVELSKRLLQYNKRVLEALKQTENREKD